MALFLILTFIENLPFGHIVAEIRSDGTPLAGECWFPA
ncbi:hypothetical protein COMA1_10361 [Candidatus Nitrospira nitrosa]|uniref:Uncharacterized protein n=1 Tax=Candidatus Nitrospira nitrosa TaxID=1742972 RepID=A0A0S4L5M5_9BACT|nr:hypothetical protein COMA1_10361 [Candidatus Nitrospira nitrosa]